jgi:two-component system osmolarity sensor histidine kinase EnvZ
VIEACMYAIEDHGDIKVNLDMPKNMQVLADEVELARVISNLLGERAPLRQDARDRRGRWWTSRRAARNEWVLLKVRDHGMGVSPEALPNR